MRLTTQSDFKVRVDGVQFAAAHFATFEGECEPLHGHNYEVAAELQGTLAADSWVIDFRDLKTMLRKLCDELDHRFLLQRRSDILEIDSNDTAWKVRTPARIGYVLPKTDVVALEIDNTTSERLAEWLTAKLWKALDERGATNIASMTMEVREGPDQRASHSSERLPQE
jgi:6-pyruvoyltetrahydropterin/6-carboxytetrahydropterin synthase